MKKVFFLFDLVFIVYFCFPLDPAEGYWMGFDTKTGEMDALWEIYVSDGKLVGKLLFSPGAQTGQIAVKCKASYKDFPVVGKVNQMPIIGTTWIFGLVMEKPGQWVKGNIIDARNGSMYQCKITFWPADGKRFGKDSIELRGELIPGIGASIFLEKVSAEEALALSLIR